MSFNSCQPMSDGRFSMLTRYFPSASEGGPEREVPRGGERDLVGPLLGKSNAEKTKKEAIGGAYINIGFNESLPLLHHRAKFVSGEVHVVRRLLPSVMAELELGMHRSV